MVSAICVSCGYRSFVLEVFKKLFHLHTPNNVYGAVIVDATIMKFKIS